MLSLISRYNFKSIEQGRGTKTLTWVCSCICEKKDWKNSQSEGAQEFEDPEEYENFQIALCEKPRRKVKRSNTEPCRFRLRFVFSDLGYSLCQRSHLSHNHAPESCTSFKVRNNDFCDNTFMKLIILTLNIKFYFNNVGFSIQVKEY
jgi:hypothetical protein